MGRVTDTISGSLATFRTPGKQAIRSLKAYFTPKQDGEGTPSPDNVRPITGWTGCEVYKAGKNIFPNVNGASAPLNLKAGTVITASTSANSGGYFRGQNASGEHVTPIVWLNKTDESGRKMTAPYTLPEDVSTGFIFLSGGVDEAQITLDGSVTYEPYQGTTLPIDWSSAGTVYGGYVDLVTGEVWETYYEFVVDGTLTPQPGGTSYNGTEATNRFFWLPRQTSHTSPTITVDDDLFCNKAINYKRGTWSDPNSRKGEFCINAFTQLHIVFTNDAVGIAEGDSQNERSKKIKAWLADNPMSFVLPLRWPTLVTTLTPTALRTLIGTNNIWCNSGDVEVEYDFAESREIEMIRKKVLEFMSLINNRKRFVSGEITISENAREITISDIPFTPSAAFISLNENMEEGTYRTFAKALVPFAVNQNFSTGLIAITYDANGASLPRYVYGYDATMPFSNGTLTFTPRSTSFPWVAGKYKYTIIE